MFKDLPFGYYKIDETRPNLSYADLKESGDDAHCFVLDAKTTEEAQ